MKNTPILVIGKTAKTGWRVEQRLQALGYNTRAVSRSSSPSFDWNNASGWQAAMEGTDTAYVSFYPDLAIPSAEAILAAFISEAKKAGLRHVVLLSGRGEQGAQRCEALLQDSGLDWNIVRASWFMQNFSEGFMIEGVLGGELILPADDTVEPFIDVDDIADVAVAALTRPELKNQLFEVTGPRAMSFAQCAEEISKAVGYPVRFSQIGIDEFIQAAADEGLDDESQWLMRELFTEVFDGRNSTPANGVLQALGRPANDFSAYLQKAIASGAWSRDGLTLTA